MKPLSCGYRIWIGGGEEGGGFGQGKYRLLRAIETAGSLREAARLLRISYRKAWGDIRQAERELGIHLIETACGGRGGGCSDLTDEGLRLLDAYRHFTDEVDGGIARAFHRFVEETGALLA